MEVGGDDDSEPGAGVDVDVGKDAALADQSEVGKTFEQGSANLGPLPDEHEGLALPQTLGQRVGVLYVIVPDGDLVVGQLLEAGQGPNGVAVVVKNRDAHRMPPWLVERSSSHRLRES